MSKISELLDEVKIYNLCNHCDFYEHTESGNGCRADDCNCKEEIEIQIVSEIRAEAIDECISIVRDSDFQMEAEERMEQLKQNNQKPKSSRQELKGFIWDIW